LSHDLSFLPLEFDERLRDLYYSEFTDRVGAPFILYTTNSDQGRRIHLINGRPPIGGDEYVGGRKLETSNVKWRIIIPRGADFDETILRSPPLPTKHEEELNRR
jgi:hypothetical protein